MSGFKYKGIDIGNQITSNNSNATSFTDYNLSHTTTSYDYQKPLEFNLYENGVSLHNQCTAAQTTHKSDVTDAIPDGAKSVRLLLRGGQGGKGGTAGNATAIAKYVGNSAKGNGGNGALGGWNKTLLTNAIIPEGSKKYDVTIGTLGTTGSTGSDKSTSNGTTTSGAGGTGGQGGTSSITFFYDNTPIIIVDNSGGPGGPGGNPAKAKSNGQYGNVNSTQGNDAKRYTQPVQPDQQNTANGGNNYPDIDPNNSTGFVQIVWLYD